MLCLAAFLAAGPMDTETDVIALYKIVPTVKGF